MPSRLIPAAPGAPSVHVNSWFRLAPWISGRAGRVSSTCSRPRCWRAALGDAGDWARPSSKGTWSRWS